MFFLILSQYLVTLLHWDQLATEKERICHDGVFGLFPVCHPWLCQKKHSIDWRPPLWEPLGEGPHGLSCLFPHMERIVKEAQPAQVEEPSRLDVFLKSSMVSNFETKKSLSKSGYICFQCDNWQQTGGGPDGLSLTFPHTERLMNGALLDTLKEPPTLDF